MNKHTPGPWTVRCVGVGGEENTRFVYEVVSGGAKVCEHVDVLDAHLIASSPSLLEAAQWATSGMLLDGTEKEVITMPRGAFDALVAAVKSATVTS